jgi:hypothetical protein
MRSIRRGNVTMVVMVFGTLLGFSALSVDVGLIRVAGTEIQVVLDAASLSAVGALDGSAEGVARARQVAVDIASRNNVLGFGVDLSTADIAAGIWDQETRIFEPYEVGDDPEPVNAIRVIHQPPTFESGLGGVAFGAVGYTVRARSMAFRPVAAGVASAANCFLPLAIPDCHLASAPLGANPPPMKFTFAPSTTDSIAWGNPTANPNSSWIIDQFQDSCSSAPIEVGDPVHVNEGVHNTGISYAAGMINGTNPSEGTLWDPLYGALPPQDGVSANTLLDTAIAPARYGHTVEGAVALVNGGADCAAVSFTADMPTTGIGWAVIYDVKDAAGNQNFWIQLDVVGEHEIWGEVDETGTATGLNVLATGDPILALW